ncbi:hypothetical protein, partial [Enterovibrio norvegicus]|uniref:hypothetical protein n=1 Tax=Enterovibrio norvegicus TaxID=188144 RepID=UPI001A7E17FD
MEPNGGVTPYRECSRVLADGGCEEVGAVCFSQSRVAFALFSYFYEQNWTECRVARQHGGIRRLAFTLRIFWTVELDKETQQKKRRE